MIYILCAEGLWAVCRRPSLSAGQYAAWPAGTPAGGGNPPAAGDHPPARPT
jgi:hypothetical protein